VCTEPCEHTWSAAIDACTAILREPIDIDDEAVQDFIIDVRSANGFAGWKCPKSVLAFQAVAAGVQVTLSYHKLSEADRESMDDYIQLCLKAAVLGYESLNNTAELRQTLSEADLQKFYGLTRSHADPDSKRIVQALSKITNPDLLQEIKRLKPASSVLSSLKNRVC
jgi:hypothetical protein